MRGTAERVPSTCPHAARFAGRNRPSRYSENALCNGVSEKLVLAPKVLVKAAHRQARCFHYAGDARTAQPLSAELASGVPHDTIAGSRLVFRFVTHISFLLDYIIILRFKDFSQQEVASALQQPVERSWSARSHWNSPSWKSASVNSSESMGFLSVMVLGCGPQTRRTAALTNSFTVRLLQPGNYAILPWTRTDCETQSSKCLPSS